MKNTIIKMSTVVLVSFLASVAFAESEVINDLCDVESNNYHYTITRKGREFTSYTEQGNLSTLFLQLNQIREAKICTFSSESSICDIENNNNHYAITRNGREFTPYTEPGDLNTALLQLAKLISHGICHLK